MQWSEAAEKTLSAAVKGFSKYKVKLPKGCGVRDPSKKDAHTGKSVRAVNYKGHDIEVITHYELKIDGKALPVHVEVGDDGSVHCHSLPNYSFRSVIHLVRELIDMFERPLPRNRLGKNKSSYKAKSGEKSVAKGA